MFQKHIPLIPLMAALTAVSASAADITLYGKIDTGLSFSSTDSGQSNTDRVNKLQMASGTTSGSRWGIKGSEDLGNGLSVGFVLESGFSSDDGSFNKILGSDKLFSREAMLYVDGALGRVQFGRMGTLTSGYGQVGLFGGNISVFGPSWGEVAGHRFIWTGDFGPIDNLITYATPQFGGWRGYVQYSFDTGVKYENGIEGTSSVNRYYAAALSFKNANTEWNTSIDSTNYASFGSQASQNQDDSLVFASAAKHNLGMMKLSGGVQYFKNARLFTQSDFQETGWLGNSTISKDGYGVHLGVEIPMLEVGTAKIGMGYLHAEESDKTAASKEFDRYSLGLGYWHKISKRTSVYTACGYMLDKLDGLEDADRVAAAVGMVHNF